MFYIHSPSLPTTIDPIKAVGAFKKQRPSLNILIRHCLPSLTQALLSESLIPQDVCDKANNESLGITARSAAVLDCMESRIQAVPSDFTKIHHILESESFLESQAKELVSNYCE